METLMPAMKYTDNKSVTGLSELKAMENELKEAYQKDLLEIKLLLEKQAQARKVIEFNRSKCLEGVDNFWRTAFSCHTILYRLVSKPTYVAHLFKFFKKLDVKDYGSRYEIHFYFGENPFFSNEVLTKIYWLTSDWKSHRISTNSGIKWKHHKFSELILNCVSEIGCSEYPNFFTWYLDDFHPEVDELGYIIKQDLWPNAVSYYDRSRSSRESSCETKNDSEIDQIELHASTFSDNELEEIDYGQFDADATLTTDEETTDTD